MPKSFKYWFADDVELTFGIKKMDNVPALDKWLKAEYELTQTETERVLKLKTALLRNADAWNEEELKVFFIAQILELVNFEIEIGDIKLKPFLDRTLTFEFQRETYKGEVDFMVAMGRQVPRKPHFFVHEYTSTMLSASKQETKKDTDPLGQLLMGMLAARAGNEQNTPTYGAYIVGRNWFFVALEQDDHYAVSDAFVATQDDIFKIIAMLQESKKHIIQAFSPIK